MSKPQIFYAAVVDGHNKIIGQRVYFDGVNTHEFFAYKQPKGDHNTAGWHVCELSSGMAVTKGHSSYPAAYDAACLVFAEVKPAKLAAMVAASIKAHGPAPEPEEIKP